MVGKMQFVIIGIYLVLLVIFGIYSMKRTKTLGDFFLGGRKMGPWITAFAYGTTYFSAVMFVGYAGNFGWTYGLPVIWIGIANAVIGTLIPWLLLGKPTRRMTHKLDAKTMPEFFEKRYQSKGLKIVAALIIFVFLVPYCASVYQGLSLFFEGVFHIDYKICMIIMAAITALYLILGGYVATALSDFFQGFVMIVGVIMMIGFVLGNPMVGGLSSGLEKLGSIDPSLGTLFGGDKTLIPLISLILLTSVGTWGLPQMVHKFYTIKDDKAIARGTIISTVFALIIAGIGYFTGAFGRLFLNNQMPVNAAGAPNPDAIMPAVLGNALPPILLGLIVAMLLAASMSTLSSLVLVSSSSIAMDLVKGVFHTKMEEKKVIVIMRVLCGVFVLFSLVVAIFQIQQIFVLMSLSWGAISGAFLAPFLLGVRWKGMTKAGAWTGIVTGLVVDVGLYILLQAKVLAIPGGAPAVAAIAMVSSFILTVVVSLVSKKFAESHVKEAFSPVGEAAEL
jgi:SSS family solute:Na+ symporter